MKTRLPGEGPFKTTDEAVKNAFIRFVELEITFPDQFMRFTLVANCDFYDVGKAETNLRHVLDLLRSKPATTFKGSMKLLIEALQAHHNCTKKIVLSVLSKVPFRR